MIILRNEFKRKLVAILLVFTFIGLIGRHVTCPWLACTDLNLHACLVHVLVPVSLHMWETLEVLQASIFIVLYFQVSTFSFGLCSSFFSQTSKSLFCIVRNYSKLKSTLFYVQIKAYIRADRIKFEYYITLFEYNWNVILFVFINSVFNIINNKFIHNSISLILFSATRYRYSW